MDMDAIIRQENIVQKAREMYADGSDDNIEIDDDAMSSESESGMWVQAWVWIEKVE